MTPVDIESVDPHDTSVLPVSPGPDDSGNTCQDPVDPPQVDSGGSVPKIPTPNTPHKAWLPPLGSEPSGRNERRRSSGISELYGKFQTGVLDKHATIPNKWASLIQMIVFFLIGLGLSLAHCCYYWKLDGREVGASWRQEEKLRVGTALSFLAQLALTASIWKAYTQWLWRAVERKAWTANGLDKAFGADTAPSSLISWEFIRNFRLGAIIAFFAWCLILPAFFTPAALYVYQSTKKVTALENVPTLAIANSSVGHEFAYSSPWNDGETSDLDTTRVFMGPRSVLTLLASASSSIGEILPIEPPSNHSTYSLDFYGPSVRCQDANDTTAAIINKRLEERMTIRKDTARQIESAYFAFVPAINDTGDVIALSAPCFQDPSTATNELWLTF